MQKEFEDIKQEFEGLKRKFKQKSISEKEFKSRLKRLQLKDPDGRCWTIGAQTGEWYYYDGHTWIQDQPPSLQDRKGICIYCGSENDLESDSCLNCGGNVGEGENICPDCGQKLDEDLPFCPDCSQKEIDTCDGNTSEIPEGNPVQESDEAVFLIRSVNPLSLSLFLGGWCLIIGIVLGAFAGATDYFRIVHDLMPPFLHNMQGSLSGGVVYSLFGGLYGFFLGGICGFLSALISNLVFSFFGGIKVKFFRLD
ncbi:hypothetical protein ACFLT9_09000 [Acidobacteriota bacterium]